MKAYAVTDVGRSRSMNQDSVFASVDPVGPLSNLYMVADGMGGHQSGDLASRYLVRNLCTYIRETDGEPPEVLLRAVQQVNGELYQLSTEKPEYAGMGTTLVAATVKDGVLYVANVGDSRLYLVRRDGLKQVTRDHSFVEEMVSMGRMERGSQSYLEKKNIITRRWALTAVWRWICLRWSWRRATTFFSAPTACPTWWTIRICSA